MLYRMKLGVQRYWRWTSTGSKWHWPAGLGSPVLALLIVMGALNGEVKEQSSSDSAFAPSLLGPPPTVLPIATSLTPTGFWGLVVRVINGDTVEIDRGPDGRATVRYIGIDAPEAGAPGQAAGCYGSEASNRNRELVDTHKHAAGDGYRDRGSSRNAGGYSDRRGGYIAAADRFGWSRGCRVIDEPAGPGGAYGWRRSAGLGAEAIDPALATLAN
jgi:hypothetical protein